MKTLSNLAIFIQDTQVRTLNSAIAYPETISYSAAKLGQIREGLPEINFVILSWIARIPARVPHLHVGIMERV